jgi:hypothetical protein
VWISPLPPSNNEGGKPLELRSHALVRQLSTLWLAGNQVAGLKMNRCASA